MQVARAGGGAVDAAVAAMTVAMSTEPGILSPLGGAFVTVWRPGEEPHVVDGNVEMPGRGLPVEQRGTGLRQFYTEYGGGLTLHAGHGSAATPGAFAALEEAHQRHGRLPWRDVLAPAVAVTAEGFRLGGAAATYLGFTGTTLFGWDPETAALVLDEHGSPRPAGSVVRSPDLSASLQLVAARGARVLYDGEIGQTIAADCARREGLITAADLAAYRPVVRPALQSSLGGWTLATNPPPSIGGPLLTVMLAELVAGEGRSWADVIRIQRQVLTYRHEVHDFSEDLEEDGYTLLDAVASEGLRGLSVPRSTAGSTGHVSAVDEDGVACAVTASSGYGSGATVPGTGLLLNNCLGEPELNRRGVHALPPGTRLASNMAPTVARSDDGSLLAIGSPGADRITTALMQVLSRFCLLDVPLGEAIDRPRLHVKVLDGGGCRVEYEDDAELAAAAASSGLEAAVHPRCSMYFGGVMAALRDGAGTLSAAADPRREGGTAVG